MRRIGLLLVALLLAGQADNAIQYQVLFFSNRFKKLERQ